MFVPSAGQRAGALAPAMALLDPQRSAQGTTCAALQAALGRAFALWASANGHEPTTRNPQTGRGPTGHGTAAMVAISARLLWPG